MRRKRVKAHNQNNQNKPQRKKGVERGTAQQQQKK